MNWPQFAADASHDGFNRHEKVIGPNNVASLQQAWSFSTGSGNAAGNVVEDGGIVYAPTANGTLYALDAATGVQIWSYPTGSGFATSGSAPAVDMGLVYTICNVASGSQGMCALDQHSGALKWSFSAPGATTFAETPPVIDNGFVYFGACGTSCGYWGLREKPGRATYFVAEPGGCSLNNGVAPAISTFLFIATVGCSTTTLFAAPETLLQQPYWQTTLAGSPAAESVGGDQEIYATTYVSGSDDLFGVALNGMIDWSATELTSTPLAGPAAFAYHNVLAPMGGELYDFAPFGKKGAPVIRHTCNCNTPSASIANHVIYVLDNGLPTALSHPDEAVLWTAPGTPSTGVPIVVNGAVIGACNGSSVCAWTLPSMIRRR